MNLSTQKTYIFHVSGMHCQSCVLMTESELMGIPHISVAKSNLKNHTVKVTGDFGDKSPEAIAEELSAILSKRGYSLSVEKKNHRVKWHEFRLAFPFALGFIAIFIFLQKIGVVNLVNVSNLSYGTAFIVGLVASISTCMAVVGGLALSVSANFAKAGESFRPQILFHFGRLVSFFILGGVIGAIGSGFELGVTGMFVLNLAVAVILLILGVNLLDVFPIMKKIQPTLPKFFGEQVRVLKGLNHTLTPFLVGVATFFLPCGFTQSMQIYSFGSGSFWTGALTMFSFALGTFPVLALLSFSSVGIHSKAFFGIFFKAAGIVVIFFGLLNFTNSFVGAGIIPPLFSF